MALFILSIFNFSPISIQKYNFNLFIYFLFLSIKWNKKKKNCTRMFHMIITLYIFSNFLMNER